MFKDFKAIIKEVAILNVSGGSKHFKFLNKILSDKN